MQLRIFGYFGDGTGYGEMAREFARAISLSGVDVCCVPLKTDQPVIRLPQDMADFLNTHMGKREPHESLYCTIPMHFQTIADNDPDAARRIGWTMSEGKGTLCRGYIDGCDDVMDEVWVPTAYNKKIFEESIVKTPIYVVPLGVNTDFFAPPSRQVRRQRRGAPYTFLTNFSWMARYRKGADVLLAAYFAAFNGDQPVKLTVKTSAPGYASISEFYQQVRDASGHRNPPEIDVQNGFTDPIQVRRLYHEADCFVLPTRGEAWGLPALEAMACGLPVIITGEGGQLEFCNDQNSLLIGIKGYEKPPSYEKLIYGDMQWAEPDVRHLAALMRWAFQNQTAARQFGAEGLKTARQFTWQHAAETAASYLNERRGVTQWHEKKHWLL